MLRMNYFEVWWLYVVQEFVISMSNLRFYNGYCNLNEGDFFRNTKCGRIVLFLLLRKTAFGCSSYMVAVTIRGICNKCLIALIVCWRKGGSSILYIRAHLIGVTGLILGSTNFSPCSKARAVCVWFVKYMEFGWGGGLDRSVGVSYVTLRFNLLWLFSSSRVLLSILFGFNFEVPTCYFQYFCLWIGNKVYEIFFSKNHFYVIFKTMSRPFNWTCKAISKMVCPCYERDCIE